MLGAPDPIYVAARALLLDALDVLTPHHQALTLVGAQMMPSWQLHGHPVSSAPDSSASDA